MKLITGSRQLPLSHSRLSGSWLTDAPAQFTTFSMRANSIADGSCPVPETKKNCVLGALMAAAESVGIHAVLAFHELIEPCTELSLLPRTYAGYAHQYRQGLNLLDDSLQFDLPLGARQQLPVVEPRPDTSLLLLSDRLARRSVDCR